MRVSSIRSLCVALLLVGAADRLIAQEKNRLFEGKAIQQWIEALDSDDDAERNRAIVTLGRAGAEAKSAVPRLISALAGRQPRFGLGFGTPGNKNVEKALIQIGPAAAPYLARAL